MPGTHLWPSGTYLDAMVERGRDGSRLLVLNPTSGSEDHVDRMRRLAADHGFAIRETERAGDAIEIARTADAELVAACGGDGTLNEVIFGLWQAEAMDEVVVAVVPAGTGNNFAGNVGVEGIEHAFEVLEHGEIRQLDLGLAAAGTGAHSPTVRPFVNSCIGGLTADASARTSREDKSELGVLAYVLNTFRSAVEFDGMWLHVETDGAAESTWDGEAAMILVGNARRFPAEGRTQANVEDGLFDVAIVEERPAVDLVGEAALARLLGRDVPHVDRLRTPSLAVEVVGDDPVAFSLDGEFLTTDQLALETERGALSMPVGERYRPDPGE